MKLKREFEMTVRTTGRFIVRGTAKDALRVCAECGETMVPTEQAAVFFGIKQRHIFRIIETDFAAHFDESGTGAAMNCLPFLGEALENEGQLHAD